MQGRTFFLKKQLVIAGLFALAVVLTSALFLAARVAKAGINEWTPANLPNSMDITALALSPAFPCDKTVFAGTDGFGVFLSTEGDVEEGVWYPVNAGLGDLSTTSLAISPNLNRCDRA